MAEIPRLWGAYAHLQSKLLGTSSITVGGALEAALNIVHQPDFIPEALAEATMQRLAANAARQERHRGALLRQVQETALENCVADRGSDDQDTPTGASLLDDQIHARHELRHIASKVDDEDWDLLTGVGAGISYDELAEAHASTASALRSRVCRLRHALMSRRVIRRQA